MFLGDVVNLFIGLALTFGTMGLAVSSLTEFIASVLKLRAANMLTGLREILNDDTLTGLAGAILVHGGVNPQVKAGTDPATLTKGNTPSYIPPRQFALAVIDILHAKADQAGLVGGIAALHDPQLVPLFGGMLARAGTDMDAFRDSLAAWFDNAMDRIGGAYKRRTQVISLAIGLAVAVALNVDSLSIARALWSDPQLTMVVTGTATATDQTNAATAITNLKQAGFPFGWGAECTAPGTSSSTCAGPEGGNGLWPADGLGWLAKILGWILTASAALFGAPFWFDLLQRFVQLRGTGTAPDEKPVPATQNGA